MLDIYGRGALRRPGRFVFALALFAAASGCAVKGPVPGVAPEGAAQAYDAAVQQTERWELQGRVAVRRSDQGWTASLVWKQEGERYHIDLTGPLGQGAVELQGDSVRMRAQLAGEESAREGDPVELMRQVVGWDVPVLSLRYWVRGLADPALPAVRQWDGAGRPIALQQMGWLVEYGRHREDAPPPLPTRLTATRGEWRFKLVVDTWSDGSGMAEEKVQHDAQ